MDGNIVSMLLIIHLTVTIVILVRCTLIPATIVIPVAILPAWTVCKSESCFLHRLFPRHLPRLAYGDFPPSLVLPLSPFDIQWYKDMHRNTTHNHAHSPSVPNDGSFFLHNRSAFLAYVQNLELTDSDASAGGGQNLLTIFVIFHMNSCAL